MLIYLDANIFITYFNKEENDYSEATNEMFKDFESGKYEFVTSMITLMEVLRYKTENYDYFEQLIKNHTNLLDIDKPVVLLAAKLRNAFYAQPQPRGGKLEIADIIHVASAVAAGAEHLVTGDTKILKLDSEWVQSVIGGNTQISEPPIPRNQLWLS